jgi:hypothetical protein
MDIQQPCQIYVFSSELGNYFLLNVKVIFFHINSHSERENET